MIDIVKDAKTVKLTVSSAGQVWLLAGNHQPSNTNLSVDEFIDNRPEYAKYAAMRLPGLHTNVALLLALYEEKQQGRLHSLEVCSPRCCGPQADKADPGILLYAMRNFEIGRAHV